MYIFQTPYHIISCNTSTSLSFIQDDTKTAMIVVVLFFNRLKKVLNYSNVYMYLAVPFTVVVKL